MRLRLSAVADLMALCLVALLLLPSSAPAQEVRLPAPFSVTGVAADDVLNIRAGPAASTAIIGSFGPYRINIEVLALSESGTWGLVGVPEGNGWVSMRFLAPQPDMGDIIPRPMVCYGNEPFWTLGMYVRGDEYEMMGDMRRDLILLSETAAPDGFDVVFGEGPTLQRYLSVRREGCGDGMSDRIFGWRATLRNDAPDDQSTLTGCCTMDLGN